MAKLLSVDRLYYDGRHNAFTDLIEWQGEYYVTFRSSEHHGLPPCGDILVFRSEDLLDWEECGHISTDGDDRDPKFVDAGDRLGIVFGTWYPRWASRSLPNAEYDLISHVVTSRDGASWSSPRQVYGVNYWLWRILTVDEGFLCAAYHFARRDDRDMRTVHLLAGEDLLDWRLVGLMREGGGCGEPVLYEPDEGRLNCVIRTLEPGNHSWLGQSEAPYRQWEWTDLGVMIHAPVVLPVEGGWICAGRSQVCDLPEGTAKPDSGAHTSVWELTEGGARHVLTVPSAGDCSYCGLAYGPEGEVVMSYYSQHEWMPLPKGQPTPADIFLARFEM